MPWSGYHIERWRDRVKHAGILLGRRCVHDRNPSHKEVPQRWRSLLIELKEHGGAQVMEHFNCPFGAHALQGQQSLPLKTNSISAFSDPFGANRRDAFCDHGQWFGPPSKLIPLEKPLIS